MAKKTGSTTNATPNKGTSYTSPKAGKDSKTTASSALSQRGISGSVTSKSNDGGVVAYTKGSRFKDSDVQDVVRRVLGESKGRSEI